MSIWSTFVQLFTRSAPRAEATGYQRISALAARDLLKADAGATLVDVRTEAEYRAGHIAGSILIPLAAIDQKARALLPDKQAAIVIHCQSGARSSKAVKQLLSMGYTRVFDLGGITGWPYGTVSGNDAPRHQQH